MGGEEEEEEEEEERKRKRKRRMEKAEATAKAKGKAKERKTKTRRPYGETEEGVYKSSVDSRDSRDRIDRIGRAITFYVLVSSMADTLRGIFSPFYSYVWEPLNHDLQALVECSDTSRSFLSVLNSSPSYSCASSSSLYASFIQTLLQCL